MSPLFKFNKKTILFFGIFLTYYFQTAASNTTALDLTSVAPHAITLPLIAYYITFNRIKKSDAHFLLYSVALVGLVFIFINLRDALWLLYLLLSYISIWNIFKNSKFDIYTFDKIVVFSTLFVIFWVSLGLSDTQRRGFENASNALSILPLARNEWRVNIGPPGSTIHFTGLISGLAFVFAFYRLILMRRFANICPLIFYTYLLIFSGSRAIFLSVICAALIILLFRFNRKRLPLLCYLSLTFGLLTVYGTEAFAYILPNSGQAIGSLLKSGGEDITSGRSWLWGHHLSVFYGNPLGAGSESLRSLEVGSYTKGGELVTASSESFFTYLVAVYGIFSISIFYIYMKILISIVMSGDALKASIFVMAIVSTAGTSLFGGMYGTAITLLIPLLSARISAENSTQKYVESRKSYISG